MLWVRFYSVLFVSTARGFPANNSLPTLNSFSPGLPYPSLSLSHPGNINNASPKSPHLTTSINASIGVIDIDRRRQPSRPAAWHQLVQSGKNNNRRYVQKPGTAPDEFVDERLPIPPFHRAWNRPSDRLDDVTIAIFRLLIDRGIDEDQFTQFMLQWQGTARGPGEYECAINAGAGIIVVERHALGYMPQGWSFSMIAWSFWRRALQDAYPCEWDIFSKPLNYIYYQDVDESEPRDVLSWAIWLWFRRSGRDVPDRGSMLLTPQRPGHEDSYWAILGTNIGYDSFQFLFNHKRGLLAKNITRIYVHFAHQNSAPHARYYNVVLELGPAAW